jgi:hypothetical protein
MTQRKRPAKMRACGRPMRDEADVSFPAVGVVVGKLISVDGLRLEPTMLTALQAYFNQQQEGAAQRAASSRSNASARSRPQMRRLRPPDRGLGARQSSIGRDLVEDSSARIDQADLQSRLAESVGGATQARVVGPDHG